MSKSKSNALAKLLVETADLIDRIALKMFQKDNPKASKEDFDSSPDRPRYIGYADVAVLELVSPA